MSGAALLDALQEPWRHGEHVDARGLVLDEPLVLDGLEVRGFDLSGAELRGGFSARGTRFRGLAWLRGTMVRGDCDLSGARFRIDLRADELRAGRVTLDGALVQGVLSFARARLDMLSLRRALVMANMTLEAARISGTVDLTEAEIMGGLWTEGASMGTVSSAGLEVSGRVRMPSQAPRNSASASAFSAASRA